MDKLTRYNKAIVAVVGLAILIANRHFGADFLPLQPAIVDAIIACLTAVAVERVPNKQEPTT